MLNCNYTGYNEIISFGTIAREKNNPANATLQAIVGRIATSYTQYLNNFHTLEGKRNSDILVTEVNERAALQLCYSSETKSFKFIRGKIFDIQPNELKAFCPYCLLNKPKTLDHYIGQTEFPEYSILQRNLIPCCFDCNNNKGEEWRQNSQRRFIHFYNDTFLNNRFLHAKLIYHRGEIVPRIHFFLLKPIAMTLTDFRIVKFHFKDLHLLNEYNTRANTLVSSEIDAIKDSILNGVTKPQIISILKSRANSRAMNFGLNYWEAVLYETLANNNKLINSL
jgi:hypothetical protein